MHMQQLSSTPLPHRGPLPSLLTHKPSMKRTSALSKLTAQPCRTTTAQPRRAVVTSAAAPGSSRAAAAAPSALMYSAETAAEEWSRRPVPVVGRLLEIAAAFGSWSVKTSLLRDPQRAAADMRKVLVELGPAFVKIGQALSSRPDVLPPEYITELELLQDRIPPFSNDEALQVIEQELGLPWTEVFSSLSPCPVAAASLGQVYRGRLASNGAEVAVKVQRPGVVEAVGRDTYILRQLAAIARKQAKLNTDLPALVDEWASSLFKELDYRREAANAVRFAELFSFMPEVLVPKMYLDWTTTRVLVMEWIEGERLRSASRQAPAAAVAAAGGSSPVGGSSSSGEVLMRQQLIQQHSSSPERVAEDLRMVEIGVRCSLEQMLEEGFYHADPHPGNLLKTPDGRLAYLDYGMMGSIEPGVRQALIRATLHLVNREYELLAEDFVALGLLPRGSDMDSVIPALTGVFQTALAGGVSNISFSTLSADLGRTMYKYSFRLPPYYTLLVRSLSVLEGIALASDPNYKVLGAAYPWVSRRLLLTTNSPELMATLDNLLYDSNGRFNFDRLESLLEQAAKARVEASAARMPAALAASVAAAAAGGGSGGSGSRSLTGGSSSAGGTAQQGAAALSTYSSGAQQQQEQGLLSSVAAAVGGALAGPQGSELLLSSLQLLSGSHGSSSGGGWQQQVSGRGSAAAAAGGPLALVLSPEGRHIRGILEDELAKGLDAAWRLSVDQTLDAASERIEGVLSLAAASPFGSTLVPEWLQEQVQLHASSNRARSGGREGGSSSQPYAALSGTSSAAAASVTSSSGSTSSNSRSASNAAAVAVDDRPDLIEGLLNLPRLAGQDDREQVQGLQRLAVQLAAFSAPVSSSSSGSNGAAAATQQQQQQQQQQMTPQQQSNAAALQQVRQAALVLRWFASEVQLLSPDAQREALAIPMRILSKLGSRVAARAVRAVLTPSASGGTVVSGTSSSTSRQLAPSGAVTPAAVGPAGSVVSSSSSSNASSSNASSSSGVVMTPVNAPAANAPAVVQEAGDGKVLTATSRNGSNGSNGRSTSSSPDGRGVGVYSSSSSGGGGRGSGGTVDPVGYSGVAGGSSGARTGNPLPSDKKGGVRGGRMIELKEPAAVVDASVL